MKLHHSRRQCTTFISLARVRRSHHRGHQFSPPAGPTGCWAAGCWATATAAAACYGSHGVSRENSLQIAPLVSPAQHSDSSNPMFLFMFPYSRF